MIFIYPFNLILMDPYKQPAKDRKPGEYSLNSISDRPMIGYAISFPIDDPKLLNIDAKEYLNFVITDLDISCQQQLRFSLLSC